MDYKVKTISGGDSTSKTYTTTTQNTTFVPAKRGVGETTTYTTT